MALYVISIFFDFNFNQNLLEYVINYYQNQIGDKSDYIWELARILLKILFIAYTYIENNNIYYPKTK